MQENRISIQITAAEMQSVKDAIDADGVHNKYLIAFTPAEGKIGSK